MFTIHDVRGGTTTLLWLLYASVPFIVEHVLDPKDVFYALLIISIVVIALVSYKFSDTRAFKHILSILFAIIVGAFTLFSSLKEHCSDNMLFYHFATGVYLAICNIATKALILHLQTIFAVEEYCGDITIYLYFHIPSSIFIIILNNFLLSMIVFLHGSFFTTCTFAIIMAYVYYIKNDCPILTSIGYNLILLGAFCIACYLLQTNIYLNIAGFVTLFPLVWFITGWTYEELSSIIEIIEEYDNNNNDELEQCLTQAIGNISNNKEELDDKHHDNNKG